MAKLGVEDIFDAIKELTVLEAAELANKMQDEFGIQAAAPVAMAVPGAQAAAEAAPVEQDEFTVMLMAAGDKKIQVIKEVRAHTQLGLKEAKELVDNVPKPVKEGISKEEAEKIKSALVGAGATVELK